MGKIFDKFFDEFIRRADSHGPGGCDTCGHGAEKHMTEDAFLLLLKDIDEWAEETFHPFKPSE